MYTPERGIISVYDKTHVVDLMSGLVERGWQLFATSGTADLYYDETGDRVGTMPELVDEALAGYGREMVAQSVSGLMLAGKSGISVACVNLRPPRLSGETAFPLADMDVGGMAMISAAGNSGALVVTQPDMYESVLEQIDRPDGPSPDFRRHLQAEANGHIMEHLEIANSLIGYNSAERIVLE